MKSPKKYAHLCVFVALIINASIAAGCSGNQVNGSNPNPVPDTWYGHNIQTVFNQHCGGGGCHIHSSANGVNLSSYSNVVNGYSGEYQKALVVKGNAAASPLYDKVLPRPAHGYRMPYGSSPLSSAQIDSIKAWINRGATDK